MKKQIFKSRKEETDFYDNLDADYIKKLDKVKLDDSKIISSVKSISLRLPVQMIQQLKIQAISMDVPYQSLIKMYIKEGIDKRERKYSKGISMK
jgi:predicted DNA binding CopG/RHH family protein